MARLNLSTAAQSNWRPAICPICRSSPLSRSSTSVQLPSKAMTHFVVAEAKLLQKSTVECKAAKPWAGTENDTFFRLAHCMFIQLSIQDFLKSVAKR
jgi:hypothetical protein